MKSRSPFSIYIYCAVLSFSLPLGYFSHANEPDQPAHRDAPSGNILIELQITRMPQEVAATLMPDLLDERKIEGAYAKIQELVAQKKVELIGWPTILTKSGQRAVFESIDEIRYASEYKPPQVAAQTITPDAQDKDKPAIKIEPKIDMSAFDAVPSAFETRNAGVTLEVEPIISDDGKFIDLNLVPQHVELTGTNKITIEKPSTGSKIIVEQPQFYTAKTTTSLTLRNGQRVFLGFYRGAKPDGSGELFLLKASFVPAAGTPLTLTAQRISRFRLVASPLAGAA